LSALMAMTPCCTTLISTASPAKRIFLCTLHGGGGSGPG
jgi:hypothetical protein